MQGAAKVFGDRLSLTKGEGSGAQSLQSCDSGEITPTVPNTTMAHVAPQVATAEGQNTLHQAHAACSRTAFFSLGGFQYDPYDPHPPHPSDYHDDDDLDDSVMPPLCDDLPQGDYTAHSATDRRPPKMGEKGWVDQPNENGQYWSSSMRQYARDHPYDPFDAPSGSDCDDPPATGTTPVVTMPLGLGSHPLLPGEDASLRAEKIRTACSFATFLRENPDHPIFFNLGLGGGDEKKKGTKKPKSQAQKDKGKEKRKKRTIQLTKQKEYLDKIKGIEDAIGGAPIRGRGAYRKGKGKSLGKSVGSKLGGWLGSAAESLLGSVIGVGDYTDIEPPFPLVNNSVMGIQTAAVSQVPRMHKNDETIRVCHREYIGDVGMTILPSNVPIGFNPTSNVMFPWLSSIVSNYQQYKVLGAVIEYKPLASFTTGSSAGMGSVSISVQYDVYEPEPTTKSMINNTMFAVSGRPCDALMCPIECDPTQTPNQPLYIGPPIGAPDDHFYSFARVNVFTQGAATVYGGAGELWITYDILLLKPVMLRPGHQQTLYHIPLNPTASTPLALYDTAVPDDGVYDTIGVTRASNTVLTLDFQLPPQSSYQLTYILYSNGAETKMEPPVTITYSNGLSLGEDIYSKGGIEADDEIRSPQQVTTSGIATMVSCFLYNGTGTAALPPTITFGGMNVANPNGADLFIYLIPTGMVNLMANSRLAHERQNRTAGRRTVPAVVTQRATPAPQPVSAFREEKLVTPERTKPAPAPAPAPTPELDEKGQPRIHLHSWECFDSDAEGLQCGLFNRQPLDDKGEPLCGYYLFDGETKVYINPPAPKTRPRSLPARIAVNSCERLNGNNGEVTNSDDVVEGKTAVIVPDLVVMSRGLIEEVVRKVIVNPVGMVVKGSTHRAYVAGLAADGWAIPALAPMAVESGRVYFWAGQFCCARFYKRVLKAAPAVWTTRTIDWLMEISRSGEWQDYPDPIVVQINGNNGEFTNTDDLAKLIESRDFLPCARERECTRGAHYHRVRNPLMNAARRLAEKEKKPPKPPVYERCTDDVKTCVDVHFHLGVALQLSRDDIVKTAALIEGQRILDEMPPIPMSDPPPLRQTIVQPPLHQPTAPIMQPPLTPKDQKFSPAFAEDLEVKIPLALPAPADAQRNDVPLAYPACSPSPQEYTTTSGRRVVRRDAIQRNIVADVLPPATKTALFDLADDSSSKLKFYRDARLDVPERQLVVKVGPRGWGNAASRAVPRLRYFESEALPVDYEGMRTRDIFVRAPRMWNDLITFRNFANIQAMIAGVVAGIEQVEHIVARFLGADCARCLFFECKCRERRRNVMLADLDDTVETQSQTFTKAWLAATGEKYTSSGAPESWWPPGYAEPCMRWHGVVIYHNYRPQAVTQFTERGRRLWRVLSEGFMAAFSLSDGKAAACNAVAPGAATELATTWVNATPKHLFMGLIPWRNKRNREDMNLLAEHYDYATKTHIFSAMFTYLLDKRHKLLGRAYVTAAGLRPEAFQAVLQVVLLADDYANWVRELHVMIDTIIYFVQQRILQDLIFLNAQAKVTVATAPTFRSTAPASASQSSGLPTA